MRGNSGFLRWAIVGLLLVHSVLGGPSRPRRMARELNSSSSQEKLPLSFNITQESDMCTQNGKEVLRSSVACEKRNGCREIETHGECCPKFLCQCKLNGTMYDNGDKIVDPENPCEVCVCRGGDINCNALKCYTRNDCKNVSFTNGVCCPEYTNCPPLENVELNSSNETTATISYIVNNLNSPASVSENQTSTTLPTNTTIATSVQSNDNFVGIKIKEITKPAEIRITDDRPKVFKPIKSSEIIPTSSLHSTESFNDAEYSHQSGFFSEEMSEIEPEVELHSTFTFDGSGSQPFQLDSTDVTSVDDVSMGTKLVRQTADGMENEIHTTNVPISSEAEIRNDISTTQSTITESPVEMASVVHNTSVLQVGDSVVIFDRSGQTQSIPLRVAGLQRGEDTYDEDDERKEGRKTDSMESSTAIFAENSSIDGIYDTQSTQVHEVYYYEPEGSASISLDYSGGINTASDEGFIDGSSMHNEIDEPSSSALETQTDVPSHNKPLEDIEYSSGYTPDSFTTKTTDSSNEYEGSSSSSEEISTNSVDLVSSTSSRYLLPTPETSTEEDIVQHDQNINFPHISGDYSMHASVIDSSEEDDRLRANDTVFEEEVEKEKDNALSEKTHSSSSAGLPTLPWFPNTPLAPEEDKQNQTTSPTTIINSIEFIFTNATTEDNLLEDISSHTTEPDIEDESTTYQLDLSSNTDVIETSQSTSTSQNEISLSTASQ